MLNFNFMKTRIKEIEYADGHKEYMAQVKDYGDYSLHNTLGVVFVVFAIAIFPFSIFFFSKQMFWSNIQKDVPIDNANPIMTDFFEYIYIFETREEAQQVIDNYIKYYEQEKQAKKVEYLSTKVKRTTYSKHP